MKNKKEESKWAENVLKKEKKEHDIMTDKKQMWMDFLNSNAEDDKTLNSLATKSPVTEKAVAVLRKMNADEKELYEIVIF